MSGEHRPADIKLVNATRLHLFNSESASEPDSRHKPGHRLYLHENNMKTAKALFSVLYTIKWGCLYSPDAPVAVTTGPAPPIYRCTNKRRTVICARDSSLIGRSPRLGSLTIE
jgi:hypothetical protein